MKQLRAMAMLLAMGPMAFAATYTDQATLRDVQPTNTPGVKNKHQQHQQFDFFIATAAQNYTCRTSPNKGVNATDFVVGSPITFEYGGKNGEVKTPEGKKAKCLIVRVENAAAQ